MRCVSVATLFKGPSVLPACLLQVKIPVRFHAAYAQSAWLPFLNHVMYELKLEDIDGVYEDTDGAPVARIASLVDGGLYFARPTEVRSNFGISGLSQE